MAPPVGRWSCLQMRWAGQTAYWLCLGWCQVRLGELRAQQGSFRTMRAPVSACRHVDVERPGEVDP